MPAGEMMWGTRIDDVEDPRDPHPRMRAGEYRRVQRYPPDNATVWECCTPNGLAGNLRQHDITEHEDGTITVSPSIMVTQGALGSWHGYLEAGVWREC